MNSLETSLLILNSLENHFKNHLKDSIIKIRNISSIIIASFVLLMLFSFLNIKILDLSALSVCIAFAEGKDDKLTKTQASSEQSVSASSAQALSPKELPPKAQSVSSKSGSSTSSLSIGDEVTNFGLLGLDNKMYELNRSGAKALVLFFTTPGCPVARQSIPKLKELFKEYEIKGTDIELK